MVYVLRRLGNALGLDGAAQCVDGHLGEHLERHKAEILHLHLGVRHGESDAPVEESHVSLWYATKAGLAEVMDLHGVRLHVIAEAVQ